ncbi:hypothetical protein GCM10020358_32640 [Amorphoplanes nipponensis]|uniref:Uncharacterized protein n=1 Tax=Actinoplanes nipponensis TaxID=135950 RepID=A0A919MNT1_9ACTN|nr:hypothetical protein [Actinoplanes nipponensis]GIE51307.1 hypothetical protein Ani05nite_48410 [Actinoplanes nipponensis]
MSDWPGWTALVVSVGTLARGEYLRAQGNAAARRALVDDVLTTYEASDLFKPELPDFDARGLVDSANSWKEKCRVARQAVGRRSPLHGDLAVCISSATRFRNEVDKTILARYPDRHTDQPVYVYGEDQDRLKALIGELVTAVSAPIHHMRDPRPR